MQSLRVTLMIASSGSSTTTLSFCSEHEPESTAGSLEVFLFLVVDFLFSICRVSTVSECTGVDAALGLIILFSNVFIILLIGLEVLFSLCVDSDLSLFGVFPEC